MSILPANSPPPVSGITQADRSVDRAKRVRRAPDGHTRGDDVVDLSAPDALRGLEGNDQEEAHEDRQAHEHYAPGGFVRNKSPKRSLDVQG